MKYIEVDGEKYPEVENLGYAHSRGVYARVVRDGDRERVTIANRASGPWRWSVPMVIPSRSMTGQQV